MKGLFIFLLLFSVCHAQNREMDSLYNAIQGKKVDTNKINTLNALSEKLWRISVYDSSLKYARKALTIADSLGFDKGRGDALNNIGICYNDQGNYNASIKSYEEALNVFKKIGNKKGIFKCLNNIGLDYIGLGDYPKSLEFLLQSLSIARETVNKRGTGVALNNIGNVYKGEHNYPKALEYYQQALSIFIEIDYKNGLSNSLMNIGNIYNIQGDYSRALEYYFHALPVFESGNDKEGTAFVLANIANFYSNQKNYQKAIDYEFESLGLNKETGDKPEYGRGLSFVGYLYAKQEKYDDSKVYLDSALSVSIKTGEKEVIRDVYNFRAELDSSTGDYKKESEDYKNYISYKDSLLNEAEIKKTTQTEMNYEFGRKTDSAQAVQDKLNAVAEKEKQKQAVIRNAFIGGFSLAFIASGIFFIQRKRLKESNQVKDKLFSIISHDFRSPLLLVDATISLLKEEEDIPGEDRRILMNNLEDSAHNTLNMIDNLFEWSFSQLKGMKVIKTNVNLDDAARENNSLYMNSASKKGIALKTDLHSGIEVFADKNIVRLVMRNLINNAIKYSDKGGKISLSTYKDNNYAGFIVSDIGIGIPEETLKNIFALGNRQKMRSGTADEKSSGFGLAFCNELMGKSGGKITIESAVGKGTVCRVSFPISGV